MKQFPIPVSEQANQGATLQVEIDHSDLTETTANTAQTLTLSVSAGQTVEFRGYKMATAFKDASDAAFNSTALIIGDGSDTDRFLASTQLNENGTEVLYSVGTGTEYVYTADDTVDITFAAMSGKALNDIDTGSMILLFAIRDLAALDEANLPAS